MLRKKPEKARRKYDAEFKKDVLKMISGGRSVQDISHSLGINANMIHKWKAQDGNPPGGSNPLAEAELPLVTGAEHEQLKARLREVEQERDILKKALGVFSRGM